MLRLHLAAALVGLALACARSGTGGSATACTDRVTAFKAVFAGLPQVVHDQPGLHLYLDGYGPGREDVLATPPKRPLELPRARAGQPFERGRVLVLLRDGSMLDDHGAALATPQEAREALLSAGPTLLGEAPRTDVPALPVLFAFEAAAPLRSVAALLPEVAEFGEVQLLTSATDDRAPTEDAFPAWMKDRVQSMRTQLQTVMRTGGRDPLQVDITCPAMDSVIAAANEEAGARRLLTLVRRAPEVIERDCKCEGVDVEGLAAWMWVAREPWHPVVNGHAWSFGDETAEVVPFPASATVADLVAVVDARAGKPFRISVAPG
jgi:hypothetical protein